jgi:predicted AAA+ superfamily ATPase
MNRVTQGEGIRFLLDFWKKEYLEEFIASGGSKIKFLSGKQGSGKSYALKLLAEDGEKAG